MSDKPTTRDELLEALRAGYAAMESAEPYWAGKLWDTFDMLVTLASRLPTTCTEVHEPMEAMVITGVASRHRNQSGTTVDLVREIYRAMERARVEGK